MWSYLYYKDWLQFFTLQEPLILKTSAGKLIQENFTPSCFDIRIMICNLWALSSNFKSALFPYRSGIIAKISANPPGSCRAAVRTLGMLSPTVSLDRPKQRKTAPSARAGRWLYHLSDFPIAITLHYFRAGKNGKLKKGSQPQNVLHATSFPVYHFNGHEKTELEPLDGESSLSYQKYT